MNIDLTPLLAGFNASYIIVPVLAIAGVALTIVALVLYVTLILDLISGHTVRHTSQFFGTSKKSKMPDIFGPIDDRDQRFAQRYRREKNRSEYLNWKKDRGY